MDTRTVASVALAAACVVAVVAAAQGLESLSTDPEDLVDPGFDRLPVGEGSLESLRDEVVARDGEATGRPEPDDSGDSSPSESRDDGPTRSEARDGEATRSESAANQEASEGQESAASREARPTEQADSGPDEGNQPPHPDRDRLMWLAALGALAVAAALAYRYARRTEPGDESGAPFDGATPDSEVERAWLALVRRVETDRPETRTPGEWAALAAESGLDADAVSTLTSAFESVRYGDDEETSERVRRVRRALDRLDGRLGTDGGESAEPSGDGRAFEEGAAHEDGSADEEGAR